MPGCRPIRQREHIHASGLEAFGPCPGFFVEVDSDKAIWTFSTTPLVCAATCSVSLCCLKSLLDILSARLVTGSQFRVCFAEGAQENWIGLGDDFGYSFHVPLVPGRNSRCLLRLR